MDFALKYKFPPFSVTAKPFQLIDVPENRKEKVHGTKAIVHIHTSRNQSKVKNTLHCFSEVAHRLVVGDASAVDDDLIPLDTPLSGGIRA